MMTRSARGAAACLALALLPTVSAAQQSDAEWLRNCMERGDDRLVRHCDVRVMQAAAPAGAIRLNAGENGAIAVEGWTGNGVEIHARVEARALSEAEARGLADAVSVAAGPEITASGPDNSRDANWHVSFLVYVPSSSDLEASTNNGPLSVRGVTSRMSLETRNGPLALREVGGDVYARAQNGPLSVSLTGDGWQGAGLDAETRNGPVTLSLPEGFNAQLEAGTQNGPFSSDIPLSVTLQGRLRRGPIATTLGSGGAPIRVITTNGPMVIRRSGAGAL
jgi:hypothetical protein